MSDFAQKRGKSRTEASLEISSGARLSSHLIGFGVTGSLLKFTHFD